MAQLKILISGAGIAGNALAFWLVKLGHDVTVVEKHPCLRVNGLQIDLRGHGIEVLRRMGLESAFRSKAAPEQGLQIVNRKGKRCAYFPANKSAKGEVQSITSEFEIMRKDFCEIMYDFTKDRAKYVFGTSIESFEEKEKGGSVEVRFDNGKTEQFDLLVGADGQQSRTRKLLLKTDDAYHPVDNCVAYFTIPLPIEAGEEYLATMYIAPGDRYILMRRHSPERVQIYLSGKNISKRIKSVKRGDVEAEKAALIDVFRGAGWKADSILEALKETDDFYCERQGLVKMDSWSQGCVTFVGDAGYCPTASVGMGTTCAFVGAYVLAGEIGRHCGKSDEAGSGNGLVTALRSYEDVFRPFMERQQKGVGEPNIFKNFEVNAATIAIVQRVLWLAAFVRADLLAGKFLHNKLKGWELPDYDEMVKA